MKKLMLIGGLATLCPVLFLGSLLVFVRMRGGISADSALTRLPLLGALMPTQQEPYDAAEHGADGAVPGPAGQAAREVAFLRHGEYAQIRNITADLSTRQAQLDEKERRLQLRERQLEVMATQLKHEADELRRRMEEEREKLARERLALDARRNVLEDKATELAKKEMIIRANELAGMTTLSEAIGSGMTPEAAAKMLVESYTNPQIPEGKNTVVKVLSLMEARRAGKILEAILATEQVGPKIAAEIAEELKKVSRESDEGE
jgi:hypothetical protein